MNFSSLRSVQFLVCVMCIYFGRCEFRWLILWTNKSVINYNYTYTYRYQLARIFWKLCARLSSLNQPCASRIDFSFIDLTSLLDICETNRIKNRQFIYFSPETIYKIGNSSCAVSKCSVCIPRTRWQNRESLNRKLCFFSFWRLHAFRICLKCCNRCLIFFSCRVTKQTP